MQDITVHQKREEKKLKALVEYNNQNRGWYFDSSSKWLAKYQKNLDKSKQPEQRQWNQNALAQQLVVMAPLVLPSLGSTFYVPKPLSCEFLSNSLLPPLLFLAGAALIGASKNHRAEDDGLLCM